jgi:hypothetical protein
LADEQITDAVKRQAARVIVGTNGISALVTPEKETGGQNHSVVWGQEIESRS